MMRYLMMAVLLAATGGLRAAVDWPADFDEKLAERVAAWQPRGESTASSAETLDGNLLMAGGRGFSDAYGTESEPFDVNWHTFGFMFFEGVFKSTPPTGYLFFYR